MEQTGLADASPAPKMAYAVDLLQSLAGPTYPDVMNRLFAYFAKWGKGGKGVSDKGLIAAFDDVADQIPKNLSDPYYVYSRADLKKEATTRKKAATKAEAAAKATKPTAKKPTTPARLRVDAYAADAAAKVAAAKARKAAADKIRRSKGNKGNKGKGK
jgi:hypothetical protein